MASPGVSSIESIDALVTLAKIYKLNPKKLPRTVHVCAAGCTELAHPKVHKHFNKELYPSPLASYMASPRPGDSFVLIQMNQFMTQKRDIHSVWNHTLDGKCMLHAYRRSFALDPMQNVSIGLLLFLILWLQSLSNITDAHIVVMCAQGKHRSMYMSHLLVLALQLVFSALELDVRVYFKWVAGGRVLQEIETDTKDRQVGPVTKEIAIGWLHHYNQNARKPQMFVLNLTDENYKCAFGTNADADNFNLGLWINNVEILPIGKFQNLVPKSKTEMLICFLINCKNVLESWHYFVRHGVLFPERCCICTYGQFEWPYDPLQYFGALVKNIRAQASENNSTQAASPRRLPF